jgi:SAM-dependent MidA family methyltransferase
MTILSNTPLLNANSPNIGLPEPDPEAQRHSQQLAEVIGAEIEASNGWIDFATFMHLALYAPSLGYYSAGAKKFGVHGDFVTAPELGVAYTGKNSQSHSYRPSLFAQTLANQVAQVLAETNGQVLELGAGTGRLALDLLLMLQKMGQLPSHYFILEVSAHLRQVQRETMQHLLPQEILSRVVWLDTLPQAFNGLILGNEVLDALPVHVVKNTENGLVELGVKAEVGGATDKKESFAWQERALTHGQLYEQVHELDLPIGYMTELCPLAIGLMASLANAMRQGVILMIDYGFTRQEYYHAHRNEGTLMCHYRHLAHGNPLIYVGLQDITAHVDFTRVALAGVESGMDCKGFCSQAQFLINCGITECLAKVSPNDMLEYTPLAAQAQKLLSPAEMGDLFKVIAFAKQFASPLLGFQQGDKRHAL